MADRLERDGIVGIADIDTRRLKDIPFEFSWDLQMPAPVHASWLSPSAPELIFYQLTNGQVHCIENRSGHTKWISQPLSRLIKYKPCFTRALMRRRRAM